MTRREQLDEWASAQEIEVLVADGFDEAILGVVQIFDEYHVCYDREACLKILQERDGMTREDAVEYFDFNVTGASMGDGTPAFLIRAEDL